jgi:hypothetical protein
MLEPPPDLARARELLRLIQEELDQLRKRSPRDPGVSRLESLVDEVLTLVNGSSARASPVVWAEVQVITMRVIAEVAAWLIKRC